VGLSSVHPDKRRDITCIRPRLIIPDLQFVVHQSPCSMGALQHRQINLKINYLGYPEVDDHICHIIPENVVTSEIFMFNNVRSGD
jgi:hypothetical protein